VSDLLVSRWRNPAAPRLLAREQSARWGAGGLSAAVFAAVAAPAAVHGAYFPTSWGWTALAFGWATVVAVLAQRRLCLSSLELTSLVALASLAGWTALSAVWSRSLTQTILEVERDLVYVTALAAALAIARRRTFSQLLAGVLAGITVISAYGLATRFFPERLGQIDDLAANRLHQPLGYWNAVGVFAVMGTLLALAFAAQARNLLGRTLAAATLPILLPTLYFTFGRGAWIALGVGALAMLALETRRLQLVTAMLLLGPASAAAVWLCSRSAALTSRAPTLADATHAGHRLAPIVLGLAAIEGCVALALGLAGRRVPPLPHARLVYAGTLWVAALAGTAAIIVSYGSPWRIAREGYREFTRAPVATSAPPVSNESLNGRLFSFWGNGRAELWRIAWNDVRRHPWLGSGAGTFEQTWLRERPIRAQARDAHNLYLETLAELGLPGLALLGLAFGTPVLAALRARRSPLMSGAFAAYLAYLVHAGVDWDWEMTAVTVTAVFCGAALLVAGRPDVGAPPLAFAGRAVALAAALTATACAFVGLIPNLALAASTKATSAEDWREAESQARKAIRWAPWSSEGWQLLGEAQLQQAELAAARVSFSRAIAKDRSDWNLWLDLAFASTGRARSHAAAAALRLDPLSPEIDQVRPALGLPPGRH
jgi:hypothetical protein